MDNSILDIFFIYVILLHYGQTSFGTISLQVERFEDVSLKCSVEEKDYKKASVSWSILLPDGSPKILTFGTTKLAPFVRLLKPRENDWNLKVMNVSEANSGIYICTSELIGSTTEIVRYNISIISKRNNDNDDKPGTVVIETKSGKSINMQCKVEEYDPAVGNVSWYKAPIGNKDSDGELISGDTKTYTVAREKDVWILRANIVNKASGGLYICKYGDYIVANYEVRVEDDALLLKPMYHKTETLHCLLPDKITGITVRGVGWEYNGEHITNGTKYKVVTAMRSSILSISRVAPSDSDGVYICMFNSKPIENCRFKIEVQRRPFVEAELTTNKTISLAENETANLTCVIRGRPEPKIKWYRKRKLPGAPWEDIGVKGSILLIPDIKRYAADEYICLGENDHDKVEWHISVIVNFGPEIDVLESEVTLLKEDNVNMSCLVQCSEEPVMEWYHNNKEITQTFAFDPKTPSHLEGYSAYMMTLTLRTKDHGIDYFKGTYICRATVQETQVSKEITAKEPEKKNKDVEVVTYPPSPDSI